MERLARTLAACLARLLMLAPAAAQAPYRIVIISKLVGMTYCDAVKTGIDDAARFTALNQTSWIAAMKRHVDAKYPGLRAGQPFEAGRLGRFTPRVDGVSLQVALPVLVFTRDTVDHYNF